VYYVGIPQSDFGSNLILVAKMIDTAMLPLVTLLLATMFFTKIKSFDIRERVAAARVKRTSGHVVIAPLNRFSMTLIKELVAEEVRPVVLVRNRDELHEALNRGALGITGDIRSIDSFKEAGIARASYVVACSDDDVQNAMITITAKDANPKAKMISIVNTNENSERMVSAGASLIVAPEIGAGEEIAESIIREAYVKGRNK
jgi:voltage-gated potassium channel